MRTKVLLFHKKAFANRTNLFSNRTKKLSAVRNQLSGVGFAVLEGSEAGEVFEGAIEGLVGGKPAECDSRCDGLVVRGVCPVT